MAQRPHHLVRVLLAQPEVQVRWVEPAPSRLPRPSDLLYPGSRSGSKGAGGNVQVFSPPRFPAEPLSDWLVDTLCSSLIQTILGQGKTDLLIVGKPSRLACRLAELLRAQNPQMNVLWDLMDDMPAFHTGRAASRMRRQASALWWLADAVWASSSALFNQARDELAARGRATPLQLVRNGIDSRRYLHPESREERGRPKSRAGGLTLGYVGSIAPWLDWSALATLARVRPNDMIELIGPVHTRIPPLPPNIRILPAVAHEAVPQVLQRLDWGLIPFVENQLTRAVDPIKYYEYRAAGLPVLSTAFGDMRLRSEPDGVWSLEAALARPSLLDAVGRDEFAVDPLWVEAQD